MMTQTINASSAAFVIVDMQNDFIHPQGAYGRNGQTSEAIAALPVRHLRFANAVRQAGGWIVSTHFTLVPGRDGEPFISKHLQRMRPFLGKGDFSPGSFGHDLIEELQPADVTVEKVAFSAFYQSRLDWMLRRAGIEILIFGGIVTNGGVASTARDAHVRDYEVIILEDGCAAFSKEGHVDTIASLSTISRIATIDEIIKEF